MGPLFIVIATILSVGLYVLIFMGLVSLFYALVGGYRRSKGVAAFFCWIFALLVGIPVFILDTIHTIIFLIGGVKMASSLRDWWHSGAK